jgi:tetrapyrrole methylase family protein/MazG family protein
MSNIDLYLLGAGVQFPSHLSLETIEIFDRCNRVVTNLPSDHLSLLPKEICKRIESVWHLYQPGRLRVDNYADVVKAVLAAAEAKRPIAWLTFGHPMIFDSVTGELLQESRRRNWQTQVVPAISSIDTLLATIEFEPANGIFIYEATSLVRRQIQLNPRIATMLLQPSAFQSDRAMLRSQDVVVNLAPLCDYLKQFYPETHNCVFVRSANTDADDGRITWAELRDFEAVDAMAIAGSTLFIPAIK